MITSAEISKYELIALNCRESFREYVDQFWEEVPGAGKLRWSWHIELFCDEFEKIVRRIVAGLPKEYDAIFNEPPGTSKSTIFSILGPSWCWAIAPWVRVLTASNTDNLVLDLSNKSRTVIKSEKYQKCFPDIVIREDQDTKGYFANTLGGDRLTCTVAGKSPVGFHAHLIVIDDPIDPKKALSEAEVRTAKEFMVDVIPTRKVDKVVTATVLVMQRLGLGDPTDVMLAEAKKEGAAKVWHVCLPAQLQRGGDGAWVESDVKPQTLAKRYIDGLLDPVRLGPVAIAEAKARGAHHYNTQFLQQPFNREGGMFLAKFFNKRVKAAPYKAKRVDYVDRAATEGGGCNTVATNMAYDGEAYYVGPVLVGQWETYERDDQLLTFATMLRTRFGEENEPVHVIEHEPGSSGVDAYKHTARKLGGFKVKPDRPTGEKVIRAEPFASQCAAGNVILVEDGTWDVQAWIDELCAFPHGRLLDRPDSAAGAFNYLTGRNRSPIGITARPIRKRTPGLLRIMAMSGEEAANTIINEPSLLIQITDPPKREGVMWNGDVPPLRNSSKRNNASLCDVDQAVGNLSGCMSPAAMPHGLNKLLDPPVLIRFTAIDPADHQDSWEEPVAPYGFPCEAIMAKAEQFAPAWQVLLKQRIHRPEMIAVMDDSDSKRALSVALAICDGMGLPRIETVCRSDEAWQAGEKEAPPLPHIYRECRKARGLVKRG